METLTSEMIEKARSAKSAEELLALAKEAGMEDFTAESAEEYFKLLHPTTGEVADDELENVTGGGCYNKDELVVTKLTHACSEYSCRYCDRGYAAAKSISEYVIGRGWKHECGVTKEGYRTFHYNNDLDCAGCKYIKYERGLWLCSNPKKRK